MKIFKDWETKPVESFVIFLGKDVIAQKRRARNLYNQYQKGDTHAYKNYNVQLGSAMQTSSIYAIAKYHFKLDTFNRKHIKNEK